MSGTQLQLQWGVFSSFPRPCLASLLLSKWGAVSSIQLLLRLIDRQAYSLLCGSQDNGIFVPPACCTGPWTQFTCGADTAKPPVEKWERDFENFCYRPLVVGLCFATKPEEPCFAEFFLPLQVYFSCLCLKCSVQIVNLDLFGAQMGNRGGYHLSTSYLLSAELALHLLTNYFVEKLVQVS